VSVPFVSEPLMPELLNPRWPACACPIHRQVGVSR
jgi:hypothetical protein